MTESIKELCKEIGLSGDTVRIETKRFGGDSLTIQQAIDFVSVRAVPGGVRTSDQVANAKALLASLQAKLAVDSEPVKEPEIVVPVAAGMQWAVWLPLTAATLASLGNMYLICKHLTGGDWVAAAIYTAVFSGAAMCFILSGLSGGWMKIVTALLIIFEAFCNLTGVYYGLLGRTGAPTRFLGMVTDILNTGTHYTAVLLGIAMAVLIGAVQLVSINALMRNNNY